MTTIAMGSDIEIVDSYNVSRIKDTPVKLAFEETWVPDITTSVYDTCTNIDSGVQQPSTIPDKEKAIASGVLHIDSTMEEKKLIEMKVFLENQLKEIQTLIATEVKNFDENSFLLHKKIDVVANATTRLKNYSHDLRFKTEKDDNIFCQGSTRLEEKKRFQAIELEKQRQINYILRQRANDPPGLNNGDPNKQWCYEIIEIDVLGKNDEFLKKKKKRQRRFMTLRI
ncbi:unnamed protein product [Lactuca saligna]|uniref:Uncharacterized protein n=1 Tax=Lactuca saligna TaxID=75948 RepID=A0AA35ZDT1_LACSI|nr:unnamed protein product [Lactuca saligna]